MTFTQFIYRVTYIFFCRLSAGHCNPNRQSSEEWKVADFLTRDIPGTKVPACQQVGVVINITVDVLIVSGWAGVSRPPVSRGPVSTAGLPDQHVQPLTLGYRVWYLRGDEERGHTDIQKFSVIELEQSFQNGNHS